MTPGGIGAEAPVPSTPASSSVPAPGGTPASLAAAHSGAAHGGGGGSVQRARELTGELRRLQEQVCTN
jgi:hypothetical protein